MIIWFTGQPGAGKTTLARELLTRIHNGILVDGDQLREIFPGTGFSKEERYKNIRRAQDIAKFLEASDLTPVVSVVAPYLELREEFKSKAKVVEIFVHTNETRGREKFHVAEYEPPLENFIDIDTTNVLVGTCVELIISKLPEN